MDPCRNIFISPSVLGVKCGISMKLYFKCMFLLSLIIGVSGVVTGLIAPISAFESNSVMELFERVEGLSLSRNGYTLGAVLDDRQKKIAESNPVQSDTVKSYKFQDRGLNLVVDADTHRIIVMYEHFEALDEHQIKELAGALLLDFGEPTVVAHDALFYWAYDDQGLMKPEAFNQAKAQKKDPDILATVKLNSEIPIMGKQEAKDEKLLGTAYYIISSNLLLVHFVP